MVWNAADDFETSPPEVPESFVPTLFLRSTPEGLVVTWKANAGVAYQLETATGLSGWQPEPGPVQVNGDQRFVLVSGAEVVPSRFFRLVPMASGSN